MGHLKTLGIESTTKKTNQLSGGEKQRVAVTRARDPDYIMGMSLQEI
jgi:lipoprotein-releasing system ATP-binding protein